ncbi:MAG: phosphatase PAP2 family protein [Prevotella sp.]|nr:phosphatase PAP2 family protein [Prevotella sp.]
MKERRIIQIARVVSALVNPFYLPVIGLILLFLFSYLRQMPTSYKLEVVMMVYLCTALLPTLLIRFYRHYQGWSLIELGTRERRMIPYVIAIVCYLLCFYLMNRCHIPHFMGSIVVAALAIQVVCAAINLFWKISTHSAAVGGVAGALLIFSLVFNFNPIWWFCATLVLAGVVGTSRMILRQHTLPQVVCGFLLGLVIAFFAILRF